IALTSSGAGALAWSASVKVGGGWLDVTPKTGTTPARVHVHLNPAGLDPGVYQDTVVVSAGQAVGSPARVPVDFVVAGSGPPPGPPAALAQFQNDGVTAVESGGTLTRRSALFKATASGPAGSSPVRRGGGGQAVASAFTGDVVMTFGTNTHGGLLSGTKTVAAVAGVATFADLSVDKAGGGYTLQATAGSLTAPSQSFTISPAAAAKLAFTVQPSVTQAGATITPAVRVIARDPFGNTATGFTGGVTLAISTNPSGGALHGTIPVAAAAGVASFGDLSIDKAGTGYVLKATSGTLTFATSDAPAATGRHGRPHAGHGVDQGESGRAAHRDPEGRERQPARRARGHVDERKYVDRDGEHDRPSDRQGGRLGDDHRDERREERH